MSHEGALAPTPKMSLAEIVMEWRAGCSCSSPGKPWECGECTAAMAEAVERRSSRLESNARFLRNAIDAYLEKPGCNGPARKTAMAKLRWALGESVDVP